MSSAPLRSPRAPPARPRRAAPPRGYESGARRDARPSPSSPRSTCHRGDDRDHGAIGDAALETLERAHVFRADEDVEERAQLAGGVEHALEDPGRACTELAQRLVDGRALDQNLVAAARVVSQR